MCLVPGRRGSGAASPLAGAQALPLQSRGSGAVEGGSALDQKNSFQCFMCPTLGDCAQLEQQVQCKEEF